MVAKKGSHNYYLMQELEEEICNIEHITKTFWSDTAFWISNYYNFKDYVNSERFLKDFSNDDRERLNNLFFEIELQTGFRCHKDEIGYLMFMRNKFALSN